MNVQRMKLTLVPLTLVAGEAGALAQAHPHTPPEREARPQLPTMTAGKGEPKMRVESNVKSGAPSANHNQTVSR